jgi:hypothetical protein
MPLSEPSVAKTRCKTSLKRDRKYRTSSKSMFMTRLTIGVTVCLNSGIYVEQIFIKDMTITKELQRDLSMTSKT